MKKFLFIGILFTVVPFVTMAQTTATTSAPATSSVASVAPGLVPGDFFYFLDGWGEAVRTFFTFNKEAKARLNLEYARERAAEIKQVLSDPVRKLEDVAGAKENFDKHIADAAATIKEEKANGVDVSGLAKELDDELDASNADIKDALVSHENRSGVAEAQLRAKIAALPVGDPQIETLTKALEAITKERENAQNESSDLEGKVLEQQATFEDAMGPEVSAKKHIEQVLRLQEWIKEQGGRLPTTFSSTTEQLLKEAENAFKQGNFELAKTLSEEAKHSVERAKEGQDSELNKGDTQEGDKGINNGNKDEKSTGQDGASSEVPNYRD